MTASPTLQEWKSLYDAALQFREIECWNWMTDDMLFGVQNPEDNEVGYCCVLGALGETFALNVYLGSEGLNGYLALVSGKSPADEEAFRQKCLMASFGNKADQQKQDLDIIKQLGLKFKGRHAWPLFRSYEPGWFPWYLTQAHVRFLTLALERAREFALSLGAEKVIYVPPNNDVVLVHVPHIEHRGITWKTEWQKPTLWEPEPILAPLFDQEYLAQMKRELPQSDLSWELDYHYAPFPVNEERSGRPYFPFLFACVDQSTEFILDFHFSDVHATVSDAAQLFFAAARKISTLPKEVHVKRRIVAEVLRPTLSTLGIAIKLRKRLPVLERVERLMTQRFM